MVAAAETSPTSLRIERTIEINAPIGITYEVLLAQLGPDNEMHDGTPMPMKFEAFPGGRWFRDLGDGAGHWWGSVQVIKPPKLIEIHGPMFMSYPALSHIQYRLVEGDGQTTIQFLHRAIGELDPNHVAGVHQGWEHHLGKIKTCAEA